MYILDNIVTLLISSFFTVVGAVTPVAILIYLFSKEEKRRLLIHAKAIEETLPILEKLSKKMAGIVGVSDDLNEKTKQFEKLIEFIKKINEHKKFIEYANPYILYFKIVIGSLSPWTVTLFNNFPPLTSIIFLEPTLSSLQVMIKFLKPSIFAFFKPNLRINVP